LQKDIARVSFDARLATRKRPSSGTSPAEAIAEIKRMLVERRM
jgi:hypothetical protein